MVEVNTEIREDISASNSDSAKSFLQIQGQFGEFKIALVRAQKVINDDLGLLRPDQSATMDRPRARAHLYSTRMAAGEPTR